ncbi:MAG: hypothetical protein JRJ87_14600 [Deltaproteobacteria bacterium]|nr:hypothetical protein [Deltaproteobacteria bacterium]
MKASRLAQMIWLIVIGLLLEPGCEVLPLQSDLAQESIGDQVVEFFQPAGQSQDQATAFLAQLVENDQDIVEINLATIEGNFSGEYNFETLEAVLVAQVTDLTIEMSVEKMVAIFSLEVDDPDLTVKIYQQGEYSHNCSMSIAISSQLLQVDLILVDGQDGGPVVTVGGLPNIVAEPINLSVSPDCPQQPESSVNQLVAEALELALLEDTQELVLSLAAEMSYVIGLNVAVEGSLLSIGSTEPAGGEVRFKIGPGSGGGLFDPNGVLVRLQGGFESTKSSCVPTVTSDLPAVSEPAAQFAEYVPGTGEDYQMGISLSAELIHQGLVAAYRGGLFCRSAGAGDLPEIDLAELFPSLEALGVPDSVRLALWPGQQPTLELSAPHEDLGETLPRMSVFFSGLKIDLYVSIEGSDVRLLGIEADVSVELSPRFEEHLLEIELIETHVAGLTIEFSELLMEAAGPLRSSAETVVELLAAKLIDQLDSFAVPRPGGSGSDLLGFKQLDGRLVFYFGQRPEP